MATAIVLLVFKLLTKWGYSKKQIIWSYFFVFLCGSLGFIPKLLSDQGIFSGESAFWANQSVSIFLNPPFALSIVFLLLFLLLLENKRNNKIKFFLPLIVVGGILAQTKIYAFILLVGSLFFTGNILLSILIGLAGLLITLPFTKSAGFPFVFEPLWFPRTLFASSDRVSWPKLSQAWQTYENSGSFPKLILVNVLALTVFVFGNLSVRILGLVDGLKKNKMASQKVAMAISIFGLLIPLIFVQNINPWNSIQFLYYSLFFLGLFTGGFVGSLNSLIKNKIICSLVFCLVIFISLPTTIGTLKDYVTDFSSSRITYPEMAALSFLRSQPKGIVLAPYFRDGIAGQMAFPRPLFAYVSTAYISAFSGQPELLSDTINLDITGFDYTLRSRQIQRFYNTNDIQWSKEFLDDNNIEYIYETPLQKMKLDPEILNFTEIFNNGEITIYKNN